MGAKDIDAASDAPTQVSPYPESEKVETSSSSSRSDLDDEYNLYKRGDEQQLDPSEAKRVLRKIDRRILPILFIIYLLQYLDKNGINYASAYGLRKDTHLVGQDFSWLGSIFYFGYLWAQYPAGYLLQRLRIGKVIGCTTTIWGIIIITTPACSSFAGLAVNRFLLGTFEAVINPGFVMVMSIWWQTAEQPLRLESYYCTNGLATMVGGLIGYALGTIKSKVLPTWMYVFLVFGSASIIMGIATLIFMPDMPSTAKFLSESERLIAAKRVSANRQGIKNRHFKKYQAWQAFRDPKTWILFIMAVGAQIPNSALTQFTSIVIASFNVSTLGTQYLQIPGGAVQFLALLFGGWICSRYPNIRCITMSVANVICIIGSGLLVGLPNSNRWGRLVGLWLCYFQGLGFSMSLTMVSSNVAGTTKKQITGGVLFVGYCVGNIIGPQTFKDSEAPRYHSAYIAMMIGYIVKLLMVLLLYFYMWSVNKKRDRAAMGQEQNAEEKEAIERGMHDVTELDNPGFRYTL